MINTTNKIKKTGFVSPPVIFIFVSIVFALLSSSGATNITSKDNVISETNKWPVVNNIKISTTTESLTPAVKKPINSKTEEKPIVNSAKTEPKVNISVPVVTTQVDDLFSVTRVVDGDTIDVSIGGEIKRLRLIGINTPETVDPRKSVECFGNEASNKAKSILSGKKVKLESDITQGELDKYDRLLRYVFLEDGTNFNLLMIKEGYAYEYTYELPYKYQSEFKGAQKYAQDHKLGLWGGVCQNPIPTQTPVVVPVVTQPQTVVAPIVSPPTNTSNDCTIKGNINSKKEKIYHMIGCGSYNQTVIDTSAGERWFCTEQEALNAGWRKALNCN